jgi:hypothetical protein
MHVCGGFFVLWQQHEKHEEKLDHVHYKNHHKEFQFIKVGVVGFENYAFHEANNMHQAKKTIWTNNMHQAKKTIWTNNMHQAKKTIWRKFAPSWTSSPLPSSLLGNAKLLHQNMQLLFLVFVDFRMQKDIERKKYIIN